MARAAGAAVGLHPPRPAGAEGVLSPRGAANCAHPGWCGFHIRTGLEARLGVPVVYINDANAAALYAHQVRYGAEAWRYSSVAAIVGTGLGGGVVEAGRGVRGAAGRAAAGVAPPHTPRRAGAR